MAGVDKVGHLIDIPVDPRDQLGQVPDGPGEVRWDGLVVTAGRVRADIPSSRFDAGSYVAVVGQDSHVKSALLRVLAGLNRPASGVAEVAGLEAQHAARSGEGRLVGYAGPIEVFHASLRDNIDLGRKDVTRDRVRQALQAVGLWDDVLRLPDGVASVLQTGGFPLNKTQSAKLMIARAIAARPSVLVMDGLLDDLARSDRELLWNNIASKDRPWTIILATNRSEVAQMCDQQFEIA